MYIDPYHYTECGLKNVYLVGVQQALIGGDLQVSVPDIQGLHRILLNRVLRSAEFLTGEQVRFIRSELNLSKEALARVLSYSRDAVEDIEFDGVEQEDIDNLIRQFAWALANKSLWPGKGEDSRVSYTFAFTTGGSSPGPRKGSWEEKISYLPTPPTDA